MITLDRVSKFYRTENTRRIILNDQSLYLQSGCSYGLLGVNGAGKSTTMRLLSGAELPSKGVVRRDVRVSWPLGLASGFNGLMSGRENLKFVARAYGEDHKRVLRFVTEFAEIGDYINEPVKTYSSGMMARFAFGLSMAIEFDCYLVDEILAVGDARFQRRCGAVFDRRRENADIIMVTHDMSAIHRYCDKAMVLVDGNLILYEQVDLAVEAYARLNR